MTSQKYNIVLLAGKGDAGMYEHALLPFSIHYCLSISKKREFMPNINADERQWRSSYNFDGVDWNTLLPLDENLIEDMRSCETYFLAMCVRLEDRGHLVSYQKRKRLYLQTLRFCNHILLAKKIDLFLSTSIPHIGISFVFYSLCKKLSIPCLFPYHADPFADAFYLQEGWEDPCPTLKDRYQALLLSEKDPLRVALSAPFEEYWRIQTGQETPSQSKVIPSHCTKIVPSHAEKKDLRPWYLTYKRKTAFERWAHNAFCILWKDPLRFFWYVLIFIPRRLHPSFVYERVRRAVYYYRSGAVFRYYHQHAAEPDLSQSYLYIPLQTQPEATTLPMGGVFYDQELMVQMLSFLLPKNTFIYIKEHPRQQLLFRDGRCRSKEFYKNLLDCGKVRFVPTAYDSYRLIEHAKAVVTVTGTPGLEALFREKPVLLFGNRFFQYASGVFMIKTKYECEKALREIFEKGVHLKRSEMRLFLKAIEDTAISGTVGYQRLRVSRFSAGENACRAGTAIAAEIERRLKWMYK